MAIIGALPVTLTNGTTADATQVMSDFSFIQAQVNANAAPLVGTPQLTAANVFTLAQTAAAATASTQLATLGQVRDVAGAHGTDTGLVNVLTVTLSPAIAAYVQGIPYWITVGITNTGPATLNINTVGAAAVINPDGAALGSNELISGRTYPFIYNGVAFVVFGTGPSFPDSIKLLRNATDATKLFAFDLSTQTTGTTTTVPVSVSGMEQKQGTNIVSAGTLNLDTATGQYVFVSGATGISAVTLAQGREREVTFLSTPTITPGASLITPTGLVMAITAGDVVVFRGEAAGVVRITQWTTISGRDGSTDVLIATATTTGGAAMNWGNVFLSTYVNYVARVFFKVSNNAANVILQFSEDGGGSYKSGGTDYQDCGGGYDSAAATFSTNGNNSGISLSEAATGINNSAAGEWEGIIYFTNPTLAGINHRARGQGIYLDAAANYASIIVGGVMTLDTNALTGFRLIPSAGTITGTISLEGFKIA